MSRIFIGGLTEDASRTELEREFEYFGSLRDVWVARNPPGFGFIVYEDARDAEDAVRQMDGKRVCGTRIRVEFAKGGTGGSRGRGRGGGGGGGGGGRRGGPPPFRDSFRESRGGGGGFGGRRRSRYVSINLDHNFIILFKTCCSHQIFMFFVNFSLVYLKHLLILQIHCVQGNIHLTTSSSILH